MILSTFSHYSIFHLAANMFVLHSFSSLAVSSLGKEQFVALYLCSGLVSSFTSHVYKTIIRVPNVSLGAVSDFILTKAIIIMMMILSIIFIETHNVNFMLSERSSFFLS